MTDENNSSTEQTTLKGIIRQCQEPGPRAPYPFYSQAIGLLADVALNLQSSFQATTTQRNGQVESIFEITKHHTFQLESVFQTIKTQTENIESIVARVEELEKARQHNWNGFKRIETKFTTIFNQLADLFKISDQFIQHEAFDASRHKTELERHESERHTYGKNFNIIFEQLGEFAKELSEMRERPDNQHFQLEAEGWELIAIIPSGIDARSLCEILGAIEGGPRESRIESNAFGKIGIFRKAVENV